MRRADGAVGLGCAAAGLTCFLLVAVLGPSVMQPALPGGPGEPPYSLVAHPAPRLVIALTVAGVALAAVGLALCCRAARRGWAIRPGILLAAGAVAAVAFMMMPPVGAADHLNYAAYGRMLVTGHDPYATVARDLPADPIAGAVQDWRDVPTVYGPVATAQEAFASLIGGTSVRLTVFVMSVTNVVAFLAAGLLLWRAARGDPGRELRAVLLWTANPLLLFALVSGAHNDVLAIAFAVAGLVVFAAPGRTRRRPGEPDPMNELGGSWRRTLAAGALIGAGAAVKANVLIVAGAPAWILLGRWWRARTPSHTARLAALLGGGAVVAGGAYLIAGPHAFDQLGRASRAVSLATPWHLFAGTGGGLVLTLPRSAIRAGSVVLAAVLLVLLYRARPDESDEGTMPRVAAALALAWLFAAPYALPWYDGLGWATLALTGWAWPGLDRLVLTRSAVLALAYLPARDPRLAGLPHDLDWLVMVVRARVTPVVLTMVLLALLVVASRRFRASAPGRSPRAPAESQRLTSSPGSPRRSR